MSMSTSFTWVSSETSERLTGSRMLIAFTNEEQRRVFLLTVKLPKGVTFALGNLNEL